MLDKNKIIKKCISCGIPVVVIAGILYESSSLCHKCIIHKQNHLPERDFTQEQLNIPTDSISITASPSPAPTSSDTLEG